MLSVFFIALFLYPFWGLALLFLFCRWLRVHGSLQRRLTVALVVAALAALLFTPVMFGTEGFAVMAPWPIVFVDAQHSGFLWPLVAFVFILAFAINFRSGGEHVTPVSSKKS